MLFFSLLWLRVQTLTSASATSDHIVTVDGSWGKSIWASGTNTNLLISHNYNSRSRSGCLRTVFTEVPSRQKWLSWWLNMRGSGRGWAGLHDHNSPTVIRFLERLFSEPRLFNKTRWDGRKIKTLQTLKSSWIGINWKIENLHRDRNKCNRIIHVNHGQMKAPGGGAKVSSASRPSPTEDAGTRPQGRIWNSQAADE